MIIIQDFIKMADNIQEQKTSEVEEKIKIIETRNYALSLMNEEYELTMNLTESFIVFKLTPKNIISSYYYQEKFDLPTITKLLFLVSKELKEVFIFYDKIINKQKVRLIQQKEKNIINLNFINIINFDEEVETNLELKQIKLTKDDLINILLNEINELKFKKNNNSKNELINENIDKKMDDLKNEINKDIQKLLTKKLNELKKEMEIKYNDMNNEYKEKINELKINEFKIEYNENINKFKKLYENQLNEIKNYNIKEIKILKDELKNEQELKINSLKDEYNKNNKEYKNYYENKLIELKKEQEIKINEIKNQQNENIKYFKSSQESIINKINKEHELKINEIEKKVIILFEEYMKKKKLEEEDKEKKLNFEFNDNVNLINDFKCENISNMKNINTIANNLFITWTKSVAVYKIIKNNEILYELAYPDNNNGYNIIIYNILLNKITNKINNAHSNNIHRIKHYYYSYYKKHLLLTSSKDNSIKLWNISSNPISNELIINNCFDGDNWSPFCILFNKEDYYIIGGSRDKKKNIWNKTGKLIGPIEKSNLNYGRYIETTYLNNKSYILLSGRDHTESYDYNNNIINIYKSNNKNNEHRISNLFNKNNIIYLICGDLGGNIIIFDFLSTNEIYSISTGSSWVYAICSLNEKYFLAGNYEGEIKVIDFDNKSIIKNYTGHNNWIHGIEKIKIEEKGEFIISYDEKEIKIWQ